MGEGAVSVDIAQSENTLHAGPAKVVDLDEPPFVELNTGRFGVEQVRVRDPPDRDEEVGAGQQALVATLYDRDRNAGVVGGDTPRARVQTELDAFQFENVLDRLRNIGILSEYELRAPHDDRDPCAESSKDLTEFERDVTPSQDDQVLWHLGQLENPAVIQPWNRVQSWNFGDARACPGIDIDPIGG